MTIMQEEDDDEFLDFDEELDQDQEDGGKGGKETSKAPKEEVEIEIADDTPPADKGKWVADDEKDGPPETVEEEEIKQYSRQVQDRIKKLTARVHAERRAKEALAREHEEATRLISTYLNENNQLKDIVESGEKVLMQEQAGRLQASLEKAKQSWKKAYEAGDDDGMIAAQEEISNLSAQKQMLAGRRVQPLPRQQPPQRAPQPTSEALEWAAKNPWFGKDEAMTMYTQALHKDLVVNKGVAPDTKEYWDALNGDLRKRFGDRLGVKEEEKPVEEPRRKKVPVASAQRNSSGGSRKVALTESQVRLARRLGITPEQYASELLKESGNDR